MNKRSIKFRAWDSKNWVMRSWDYVRANWTLNILNGDSNTEIMQFTGSKDIKGNEIYEGDILAIDFGEMDDKKVYEVLWDDEDAEFDIQQHGYDEHDDVRDRRLPFQVGNEAEVIGNIYENPELLK